jgi:hypothetical protein
MDRRDFLKLSSLVAAYAVLNPKLKVVESILNTFESSNKVLIYLMQNTKGQWHVKVTKNYQDPKKGVLKSKWIADSFSVLEYTDELNANERKKLLWDQHKCKGQYVPYNLKSIMDNNKICLAKLSSNGFYESEKFHNTFILSGAPVYYNRLKAEGKFENHIKYIKSFITPEGRERATRVWIEGGIRYSRSEEGREKTAKMGRVWGPVNGSPVLKSFSYENRKKYASMGGLAGGAKKAIEKGTHNFLSRSPNKIKVKCPDGHITSKPSSIVYCKNRGLNPSECAILN